MAAVAAAITDLECARRPAGEPDGKYMRAEESEGMSVRWRGLKYGDGCSLLGLRFIRGIWVPAATTFSALQLQQLAICWFKRLR